MTLSTAREVFVDTSGFFAQLVQRDDRHRQAVRFLKQAAARRQVLVTTDHVLDETATLLRARGHGHLIPLWLDAVVRSSVYRVAWTDSLRFERVLAFFLKHDDQPWSFTDCVSFCVMSELNLREALTKDAHFTAAGYRALLGGQS